MLDTGGVRALERSAALLYRLMLLEILSHDDDEGDLGQANDDDQPFGLNPGY